ncbi:hypothetical protein TMatcc_010119 [Talaromyces marneffei ATCC 18224]|uniref:uncharacterized protein n=1 Tax=Talaromyces marneffei TaxID=37727 RepID=UPI0012AA2D31|nr:uncharacterized protein EYB26_009320 [Talaromyces marneffei]QGA21609.1 hypothetical protein EYB26_009320 [Talaromyces marneffei]
MPGLFSVLRRHSLLTATAFIITALSIPAYQDYRSFISYGPGGPPHNALGWFFSRFIATPFGQDMLGTGVYEPKVLTGKNKSYLTIANDQLPQRYGKRPVDFVAAFYILASKNPHIIKVAPSNAEKHSDAMWLLDTIHHAREAVQTGGEIAHIHETGDHSLHVVLSPADAKEVIEAGWDQRHAFAGWRPLGDEVDIILEIVKAALRYTSMGAEVVS